MATKRRSYFRVESKIARDDFTAHEGWFLVCLMAEMIDRWRVDHLTAEQACHIHLTNYQLMTLCRQTRADRSAKCLQDVAKKVTMTLTRTATGWQIFWPKFSETQGLRALEESRETPRETPRENPGKRPFSPAPAPESLSRKTCSNSDTPISERRRAPERVTPDSNGNGNGVSTSADIRDLIRTVAAQRRAPR